MKFLKILKNKIDPINFREEHLVNFFKNKNKQLKIIDLGAGSGKNKKILNQLGFNVKSVDNKNFNNFFYSNIDYELDINDIKLLKKKFDACILTEVLEHTYDPMSILKSALSILNKGGYLFISSPGISLQHHFPYYFFSGFSEQFYQEFAKRNNLKIIKIAKFGSRNNLIALELIRKIKKESILAMPLIFAVYLYYSFKKKDDDLNLNNHLDIIAILKKN